jgi:diadenosine tetraphosphatase ApaH/serine/threonine PP2A family protein phosphatase
MDYLEPSLKSKNCDVTTIEDKILSDTFSRDIQIKIYALFNSCAYPCNYLNLEKFKQFIEKLNKIQALDSNINHVIHFKNFFYSFDLFQQSFVLYTDFLHGLMAMERRTQHGGILAEQRCRYIFRYYTFNDSKRFTDDHIIQQKGIQQQHSQSKTNQFMNFEQFKHLIRDINTLKNKEDKSFEIEAINAFKVFGLNSRDDLLSLENFLNCVGQLKFRGTSILFRLRRPIDEILSNLNDISSPPDQLLVTLNQMSGKKNLDISEFTKTDNYELDTHAVRLNRSGYICNNTRIDLDDAQFQLINSKQVSVTVHTEKITTEFAKANQILQRLTYFERAIEEPKDGYAKEGFSWGNLDMAQMAECLICVCRQLVELISSEDRLLKIKSPCYILGDLHGNYRDLISFEKTLWHIGPKLSPASILFLGDYVDRGPHGVEVVSYLFSQKLLATSKVFLLRGNHEIRSINRFSFYNECIKKFGPPLGKVVWEEINNVFDVLPLASIVDEKIFCVHGGIPSNQDNLLDAISQIKCPLKEPQSESPIAWEILWNDPIDKSTSPKFMYNFNRGTAYFFTKDALNDFLKKNNLSYVIRAHEVQQNGFKVQLGGRLISLFSSSKYCGNSNEAASLLVDSKMLRLLRLQD